MAVFRATDRQVEFANEKYKEFFEERSDSGPNPYQPVSSHINSLFEPYVTQVLDSGQSLVVDYQLPSSQRDDIPAVSFRLTFQPLPGANGAIEGVLMMATEAHPLPATRTEPTATAQQAPLAWADAIPPQKLLVFRVVRDAEGQPQEFEPLEQEWHSTGRNDAIEVREAVAVNPWQPVLDSDVLRNLYKKVAQTGESYVGNIEIPARGGWHKVNISRRDEDTLITTFIGVEPLPKAVSADTTVAQEVLEGSLSAMLVCVPVRTAQGELVDFQISQANEAASAITGYTAEHLTRSTLLGLFPDLRKIAVSSVGGTAFEVLCEVVHTGTPLQDEVLGPLNRHEESRWYQIRASRLNDSLLLSFTDTTETREALRTVGEQNSFIQNVLDLIPSGIAHLQPVYDSRGAVTDFVVKVVNKASLRQAGIAPEEAIGKPLSTLLPGYRQTAFFGAFQQVVYFTPFIQGEFVYTYKGRNRAWINLAAARHEDGLIVSFCNVTDVKQNEQHIKESEERLQTIIDTVQISVGLLSPVYDNDELIDFRFKTANQSYASALGQQRADIIDTRLSQWIPGYLTNGLFDAYKEVYLTGEGRHFEFHYHNDGFDDWVDVKASRINRYLLVTGTNYTRLKQVQLQAEALVEDLRKSNDNLEKFAYVASHDLQEPLRKIQAFGGILQKKHAASLDESGVDLILRMQRSADRMQTLITDLLTYSRISSNKSRTQTVDLNRLLNDLLADFETTIQEKNADVQVGELPVIMGELTQLRQLFQNLLSNSLKFASQERQPRIRISYKKVVGRTLEGTISSTDAHKSFAQIEIRDNGIGFDPRYTERIFQVFQRLHGRSEYPGTGIGLAIVQKVIENHKGYLMAEGRPNEGATFRLLLPL
nr:PAS domain-containing sensor histidine kinase [Telluribacter sp. SYSU D00476]